MSIVITKKFKLAIRRTRRINKRKLENHFITEKEVRWLNLLRVAERTLQADDPNAEAEIIRALDMYDQIKKEEYKGWCNGTINPVRVHTIYSHLNIKDLYFALPTDLRIELDNHPELWDRRKNAW